MLWVPFVTIWLEKCDCKFSQPSFGDVGSASSHDIGARIAIEFFDIVPVLEMLPVTLVTILTREMRLNESFCQSREYVESATPHNVGARYAIKTFFNHISPITTLGALAKSLQGLEKNVNFQSHISREYRDWRSSQHLQRLYCAKTFNSNSCTYFVSLGTCTIS